MLKTSEESERTDDFFAPSPHPESYPSQPSLSMWGGNTWQPHRGTHCHTGAPTGYKAKDIHTVEELTINRGTTARQIYIRGTTQICMKYIKKAPQPGKYIRGSHTQMYIKHINKGTTATQIYISQPHSPTGLYAEPAEPHKAKAHHKKSQRSKVRDRNAKSHIGKTVGF